MKTQTIKSKSWKHQILFLLKDPSYLSSLLGHDQKFPFKLFNKYLPNFIDFYKKLRKIYFKGKNVLCPCCGGFFKKFLPAGAKYRPSASCPGCGSLERDRLLILYLKNKTDFFLKPLKILDIAPKGILQNIFLKKKNLEYISIDLESPLAMIKMNITNILFENDKFDVILCSHVLEHVNNDIKALKEIYRVLKPNGWAIIQSPIDYNLEKTFENPNIISPEERRIYFGEENHLRIYGRDYKFRLSKGGFDVFDDNYINKLSKNIINKYGLDEKEIIYLCKKNR